MAYDFSALKARSKAIEEWLIKELSGLRTGRANPAILDGVLVESYGAKMAVRELASITVDDARTLRIAPYDAEQGKNIEKAVVAANLGLAVGADDRGIRLGFPELSSERRAVLVKLAKEKLEEARIKLRGVRDDVWKDIQNKERDGKMGEDEKFRLKDEMQKTIDASGKAFDEHFAKKEKEIIG